MIDTTEIPRFRPLGPTHTPFDKIALAFSGGGFRAAAYGLGVLSYFDDICYTEDGVQKSLLSNVSYLSSASGGTIATAMYALNVAKGRPFTHYYKCLFEALEGTDLLESTFKKLNDNSVWRDDSHSKRRNLINAFALAYDEFLFDGARVCDLTSAKASHLEEVCFNTTEFYKGILFRQTAKMQEDKEPDPDFLFGNFLISINPKAACDLKLADILAASSCFPAGFEPIMFPDDFTYDDDKKKDATGIPTGKSLTAEDLRANVMVAPQELSWSELSLLYGDDTVRQKVEELQKLKPDFTPDELLEAMTCLPLQEDFKIGMMDGGITDNQGLESMMKANDRRERNNTQFDPFDLMIVNDVGSHFIDPYVLPRWDDDDKKKKGISLTAILIISVMGAIAGGTGLGISMGIMGGDWSNVVAVIATIILLISSVALSGILLVRRLIKGQLGKGSGLNLVKNFSTSISRMFFRYFGYSPFMVLYGMIEERANSVILLNTNVFLKRIREILYQKFFDSENHLYRIKTNHIYDMSFSNDGNKNQHIQPRSGPPGYKLKVIAETAFNMGTTLWFDKQQQDQQMQAATIACGQFTTCYNLILYIETFMGSDIYKAYVKEDKYKLKVDELYSKLNAHYLRFHDEPFWLYDQLGKEAGIKDFRNADISKFTIHKNYAGLRSPKD